MFAEYADGLRIAGRIDEGLDVIEKALGMCRRDEEYWCIPEVLRIKGAGNKATVKKGTTKVSVTGAGNVVKVNRKG